MLLTYLKTALSNTDIYKIIDKVISLNLNSTVNTIKDVINYHEKLKINYTKLSKIISLFLILLFNKHILSNEINFDIQGNKFTDSDVIISLLSETPDSQMKRK